MIVASFGRVPAISGHDHEKAVSDGETKGAVVPQTAPRPASLWQTDNVTFGRIIIGWRVGT